MKQLDKIENKIDLVFFAMAVGMAIICFFYAHNNKDTIFEIIFGVLSVLGIIWSAISYANIGGN